MKIFNLFAVAALAATWACSGQPAATENPVLEVTGGKIQGVLTDSSQVMVYKGIPYAAAPVGDLRWKKPQPVTPWEGVKVADQWGNIAMQADVENTGDFYHKEFYQEGTPQRSEDCLYLNIWAPAKTLQQADAKLPVAMWIHGGAYDHGWGYEITMDGDAWAQRGVILVTINYRVGILGFLSHPELRAEDPDGADGNYGTYDQIAALKWIHDNIATFGGDPDNITIFGQSAGAASIKNLVTSPLSQPMIAKAIIQSGGGITDVVTPATSKEHQDSIGKAVMDAAGFTDLAAMRKATAEQIQQAWTTYNADTLHPQARMRPYADGVIYPAEFNEAVKQNTIADIPYMIGYCKNDIGNMGNAITRFCEVRDSLSQKPAYEYFFCRPLPGDEAGSFHSSELWYVFHTLNRSWRPFTEADYKLSDEMVDAWTNFCKYGNPNGQQDGPWKPNKKAAPYIQNWDIK